MNGWDLTSSKVGTRQKDSSFRFLLPRAGDKIEAVYTRLLPQQRAGPAAFPLLKVEKEEMEHRGPSPRFALLDSGCWADLSLLTSLIFQENDAWAVPSFRVMHYAHLSRFVVLCFLLTFLLQLVKKKYQRIVKGNCKQAILSAQSVQNRANWI